MENKLNLSQIKKCEQVWNKMELVDGGRLCKKCDTVMIDFRGMNDYEIASIHINSEKVVCGVYDEYRLSNNPNFAKPKLKLNTLYLAGMFGLLANSQIEAKAEKIKTIQTEPNRVSQDSTKSDENIEKKKEEVSKILRGEILNEENLPVKGVAVHIKELNDTIYTDINGYFEIDIKKGLEYKEILTLVLVYIGNPKIEILISQNNTYELNTYYINANISFDNGFAPAMEEMPWYKEILYSIFGIFY